MAVATCNITLVYMHIIRTDDDDVLNDIAFLKDWKMQGHQTDYD